jgi:hypothetical protein
MRGRKGDVLADVATFGAVGLVAADGVWPARASRCRVLCGRCGKVVGHLDQYGELTRATALPNGRRIPRLDGEETRQAGDANAVLTCHPRCGRRYTVGLRRLAALAGRLDRDCLIVGDGPFAVRQGGRDI